MAAGLLAALPASAAEDPLRFYGIRRWQGTFTLDVNGAGTSNGLGIPAQYRANRHLEIGVRLEGREPDGIPYQIWTDPDVSASSSGSVHDFVGFDGNSCRTEYHYDGAGPLVPVPGVPGAPPPNAMFTMNQLFGPLTSSFTFLDLVDGQILFKTIPLNGGCGSPREEVTEQPQTFNSGLQPFSVPGCQAPIGCITLPETGLKIDNTWSFPAKVSVGAVTECDVQVSMTLTLEPALEDVFLEISADGYEDWIPEPGKSESEEGNRIVFKARLRKRGGGDPEDARVATYTFKLVKASQEPGIAVNFPRSSAQTRHDLLFRTRWNPPHDWELPADGLEMTSGDGARGTIESPPAVISSFDGGAFGEFTVKAHLLDGRDITGHLKDDPQQEQVRVPKRPADSNIADAWKRGNNAASLPDDDDGDRQPEGDGDRGDGFTLYEEYRGFMLGAANRHTRTDPHQKDLFIQDRAGIPGMIALLDSVSHLKGHRLSMEQMRLPDRVMNFNHAEGAHLGDQHGLIVRRRALGEGIAGRAEGGPGLPRSVSFVQVAPNLPSVTRQVILFFGGAAFSIRDPIRTAVHELLHATNVYHHGDIDEDVNWTVDTVDGNLNFVQGGIQVLLYSEDGTRSYPNQVIDSVTLNLGKEHGQHSGDADCMMAYKVANLYRADGPCVAPNGGACFKYYLVDGYQRFPRRSLCSAKDGTQYNATSWNPQSRFGTASGGCCRHQVCVNDRMPHAPNSAPTGCAAGGGESPPDAPPAGGGQVPVDPTLQMTVNDAAAEVVMYRGWPAIALAQVLHPRFLDEAPDAGTFTITAPAGGAWAEAMTVEVLDAAGNGVSWGWEEVSGPARSLALDPGSAGATVWLLGPEATLAIPAGTYEIGAAIDTTAFAEGWRGSVRAETVTVRVEDPPAPLPGAEEAERRLRTAIWRYLRGEPAAAHVELDAVLAAEPRNPGALALRAFFLEGQGELDAALAAYGEAIAAQSEGVPDAPEPPGLLLEGRNGLLAEILERVEPPSVEFLRADPNGDGTSDLSDAVAIFSFLFLGGVIRDGCLKSADADDNGSVEITDGIYLLSYLFLNGRAVPAPFAGCGEDPTPDGLPCPGTPSCPR